VFNQVGGEREDIPRGLDPDLRVRIRAAGYRVVLAPGCRVYHPLPRNWRALARTFFRNGFGSAYAQKFHAETVFDTHEHLSSDGFNPRRPVWYRLIRFPARLAGAVLRGQGIRFVAYCVYTAGYVYGLARAKRIAPGPAPAGRGASCAPGNDSRAA
jgi:hypothetical protein